MPWAQMPCNNQKDTPLSPWRHSVTAWAVLSKARTTLSEDNVLAADSSPSIFSSSQKTFIGFHHGHIYRAISIMIKSLQMRLRM